MGSLVGTIFFMILTLLMGWSVHLIAIGFIPLFLIGIPLCTRAKILLDRNDPGEVIWDEFCVIPFFFFPRKSSPATCIQGNLYLDRYGSFFSFF